MKRVCLSFELTDGEYEVLQKISTLEKRDHSEYAHDAILSILESDIDHYFNLEHPEYPELVDKLGMAAARKKRLEASQ